MKVSGSLVLLMLWSLITCWQITHIKSFGMCLLLALFAHRPLNIINVSATRLWHTHFRMVLHIHADRRSAGRQGSTENNFSHRSHTQTDDITNMFLPFLCIFQRSCYGNWNLGHIWVWRISKEWIWAGGVALFHAVLSFANKGSRYSSTESLWPSWAVEKYVES